jgi:hypothetical protein
LTGLIKTNDNNVIEPAIKIIIKLLMLIFFITIILLELRSSE